MTAERAPLAAKEAIAAATDEVELNAWHTAAYDTYDEVKSRLLMANLAQTGDHEWRERAAAAGAIANIVMRRIERRLGELGFDPPFSRDGKERERLRRLSFENRQLRNEIDELKRAAAG